MSGALTHDRIDAFAREQSVESLMLVDDEPKVCIGLKRILRKEPYRIHIAHDAHQAMEILSRHAIDVVVSDQRMPGKMGTELLRDISIQYPNTVRLILSGAAEIQDVADAMGEGVIYKYLTKPIEPALFRANLKEAFSRASMLRKVASSETTLSETGLPTRAGLESIFNELLADAQPEGKTVCLLLLSIDQYDSVVSSYGRSFARRFLEEAARRISPVLEGNDCLGQDAPGTFLMLIAAAEPADRIMRIDHELEQLLSTPVYVDNRCLSVTLSIGATTVERQGSFNGVVDEAYTAMTTGRERGGATIQLYQPHLVAAFRDQLELETELRHALASNQFELYYQPQVDIGSGEIIGLEALLRWCHPKHGYISPARFIPVTERLGIIEELGEWVLKTAVNQFSGWSKEGVAPKEIAINVSARQVRNSRFVGTVQDVIERAGLSPEQLVLEITESVAIDRNEMIADSLRALQSLGVTLAVDDFGTGYANLSNLTRFAFRKLKIDRSLLPRHRRDERALRFYANIVSMVKELGLASVAEGVESPGELAAVYESGCRTVQGYFYAAPKSADIIGRLLRNRRIEKFD